LVITPPSLHFAHSSLPKTKNQKNYGMYCKKIGLWCAVLSIISVLHSCNEKDLESASSGLQEGTEFDVRAVNGFLEFKDQATLDNLKAQLADKSWEELDAWESQFKGFTSLRSFDEQAFDAQESWFEEISKMTDSERLQLMQSPDNFFYSDFIRQHDESFTTQDSGIYRLNVSLGSSDILGFLNKEGIYKIGEEIHAYQDNMLKIITDGDENKIKLLKDIYESNEDLEIKVSHYSTLPFRGGEASNGRQLIEIIDNQRKGCDHRNGESKDDDRVTGEVQIYKQKVTTPVGDMYYYYLDIYIEN